jgi:hypothetical protein
MDTGDRPASEVRPQTRLKSLTLHNVGMPLIAFPIRRASSDVSLLAPTL